MLPLAESGGRVWRCLCIVSQLHVNLQLFQNENLVYLKMTKTNHRVQGQWRPGGDTPRPRSGAARRSHLVPKARGGDPEEPPRAQGQGLRQGGATLGAVAAQAQEGLDELSHIEGQEWWS